MNRSCVVCFAVTQLRSFKESVAWLNEGVSVMAFPEGTRSVSFCGEQPAAMMKWSD